jgi:protein-S-isoprenylcysteine O-methyltransferase Ste14
MVKAHTKQSLRASDPLVKAAMILANLCILMTMISTYSESWYRLMGPIIYLRFPIISYVGLSLFGIGIVMGWFFSAQLKESWRIGVPKNQKTELIQDGIYAYVRNPYFLSYFVMFFSLFLIRPSLIMTILVVATIAVFHLMVLKEEAYLLSIHGEKYEKYKNTTGRYIPHFIKEITSDNS